MNAIRKYFWQLVSTLLAIAGIFATYYAFSLSQPRKELQIVYDSPISLVDVRPEAVQDIQVFYKKEPASKVYLLQIRIKNTGNQPIASADYVRPLLFSFSEDYRLADAKVIASEPPDIGLTISKTSEYAAQASSTLLNPDDTVSVRFIIIGADRDAIVNKLLIDGRVTGIKEIRTLSSAQQQTPLWVQLFIGVALGVVASILGSLLPIGAKAIGRSIKKWADNIVPHKQLKIQGASYGVGNSTKDVTQLLASKIMANKLEIQINNDNLGGDPAPKMPKELRITYSYGNKVFSKTIQENDGLNLP